MNDSSATILNVDNVTEELNSVEKSTVTNLNDDKFDLDEAKDLIEAEIPRLDLDETGNLKETDIPQMDILQPETINEESKDSLDVQEIKISGVSDIDVGGEVLAFIDGEGYIQIKEGKYFKSRRIGRVKGNYKQEAIDFYIQKFTDLEKRFLKIIDDFRSGGNKYSYIDRIKEIFESIHKIDAIGNFDLLTEKVQEFEKEVLESLKLNLAKKEELVNRAESYTLSEEWKKTGDILKKLQEEWKTIGSVPVEESEKILNKFNDNLEKFYIRRRAHYEDLEKERAENLRLKEEICQQAESLISSVDWKQTNSALKKMQEQWKEIGPVPSLQSDIIWSRFRGALDKFYERLRIHYDEIDKERLENLVKKEELCKIAETLKDSTSWDKTAEKLKNLQEQWRDIGPVPMEQSESLWARFRAAQDSFFVRFREHLDKINMELNANFEKKEVLCQKAESLSSSTDWFGTAEELKKLQEEWKTIGPVQRKRSEELWNRFRKAMDVYFEERRKFFDQKKSESSLKQQEWKNRMSETLQRKQEQLQRMKDTISRDELNISRWQTRIDILSPLSEGAAELKSNLEEKIIDVKNSMEDKQIKISELEKSIEDIKSKIE